MTKEILEKIEKDLREILDDLESPEGYLQPIINKIKKLKDFVVNEQICSE